MSNKSLVRKPKNVCRDRVINEAQKRLGKEHNGEGFVVRWVTMVVVVSAL